MRKGVGRIYQQIFLDTYSKVALCKLYTMHTALTVADMLNDRVIPFFEEQGVPLLKILTDRGSEYSGNQEKWHSYRASQYPPLFRAIIAVLRVNPVLLRGQEGGYAIKSSRKCIYIPLGLSIPVLIYGQKPGFLLYFKNLNALSKANLR